MISAKKSVLIICTGIIVSIGLNNAQIYSDFKNKKICHMPITLDIPEIEVPAFQWAIFDYDPIPNFRKRVADHITSWYSARIEAMTDADKRLEFRNSIIHHVWEDGFEYIPGNKIYLYIGTPDGKNWYNTSVEGNYWFVTQMLNHKGELLCWSFPLKVKPGTKIELILTKENALDLDNLFDAAIAEAPLPETYPLFNDMIQALHNAKSMYYETEIDFKGKDYECKGKYKVWLKKPNFARIEAYRDDELIGTMVGDGENFWFFWARHRPRMSSEDIASYELTKYNSYYRLDATPGAHSIWHIVNRTSGGRMAFQPSYFHKCPNSLDKRIDSVIVNEKEKIGNETCDFIEVSYLDHQRSRYFWLGENNHLPRRIKEIVRVSYDIITEETWSNLVVNLDMPDSLFVWTPPEGWTELVEPSLESRLLAIGTPAPDFSFKLMDGKTFQLSEQKGKVVLINFWRVGCPPCREELPWLEEIYNEYKDKGLIVVGYNTSDEEKYIRELLNEYKATYPNIYNTSEEARAVQFEEYQKKGYSAVPLNYVIDRNGNVALVWYGYDHGKTTKIERLLEE